jgi:hypothetical protein
VSIARLWWQKWRWFERNSLPSAPASAGWGFRQDVHLAGWTMDSAQVIQALG